MSRKRLGKPAKVKTHFDERIKPKVTSTAYLEHCLAVGSKNNLKMYMSNLSVSRGTKDRGFDSKVVEMIESYARDRKSLKKALDYLGGLRDEEGRLFSRNLKIYSECQEDIMRFLESDYTSFRWNVNYQKSLERLKQRFSGLHLKPLVFCCDDDIRQALPKVSTHSGYVWVETGLKEKGKNMDGALEKYKELRKEASDSLNRPVLMGFRTQASGEFEDGVQTGTCKHKLRVIFMYDLYSIINELQFSNPFQRVMNRDLWYAGGQDDNWISRRIHDANARRRYFLSLDYSHYDQSISSWLIEDAFSVIREAFDLDDEQERSFEIAKHDFINKSIIIDEGVVTCHKGVASGSMFTQIVDTIVNWIVIMTYCSAKGIDFDMLVMGDDNVVFSGIPLSLADLSSYVKHNFGLTIHDDQKTKQGELGKRDVYFLSRYWKQEGSWRHPNELISRLAYPERHRVYTDDNVLPQHVIWGYILTYPSGMRQLIDVDRFTATYPVVRDFISSNVDSRYIPGALAYIREYANEGSFAA